MDSTLSVMEDHIKDILNQISQNPVTNVISQSGSGKTTRLPLRIAETGNKIVVVTKDKSIANSLANYVSSITNLKVGTTVNQNNNITYIGSQDFKNYLFGRVKDTKKRLDSGNLEFAQILMIDEADAQTLDQTMIFSVWRYFAENKYRIPHLLLVSTTPITTPLFNIKRYNIEGYIYPIQIRYSDKYYDPKYLDDSELLTDVSTLLYELSSNTGNKIVFCADQSQVIELRDRLHEMDIESFPVYETMNSDQVTDIYSKQNSIIITTSVGETSFSLKEVSTVIDLLLDHQIEKTLTEGTRYIRRNISKARADIRSHRGGKDRPVVVYRMMSKEMYDRLPSHDRAEIDRIPIHITVLDLIQNDLNPTDILDFPINRTLNLLYGLGLISPNQKITPLGEYVKSSPLGIRQATIMGKWLEMGYPPYPAMVILSMIDIYKDSYWVYPLKTKDESHSDYTIATLERGKRHFSPFVGRSDLHTFGRMWNIMMEEIEGGNLFEVIEWCQQNSINSDNMLEVITLVDYLSSEAVEKGIFDTDNILQYMGPIIKDVYGDKFLTLDHETEVRTQYKDGSENYYKIDSVYGNNTVEMDTPEIIYGLITSSLDSNYGETIYTISCCYTD